MEIGLADRQFYANFSTSEAEARKIFAEHYGREPEVVTRLNNRTIAGPVTKKEVQLETSKGGE